MKFEEFMHRKSRQAVKPTVTISKNNSFNLNVGTMKMYIKDYTYIRFYYDKENSLIGIKPTNEYSLNAYKVIRYKNNKIGTLAGRAFLKYYKIEQNETHAYDVEWDEEGKMIIINLSEHKKSGGGNS